MCPTAVLQELNHQKFPPERRGRVVQPSKWLMIGWIHNASLRKFKADFATNNIVKLKIQYCKFSAQVLVSLSHINYNNGSIKYSTFDNWGQLCLFVDIALESIRSPIRLFFCLSPFRAQLALFYYTFRPLDSVLSLFYGHYHSIYLFTLRYPHVKQLSSQNPHSSSLLLSIIPISILFCDF